MANSPACEAIVTALPLTARRFGSEPELTTRLARAGARIYEMPISYSGRTYAEGKKINWKDGVAAFWHLARYNFFPARKSAPLPPVHEFRRPGAAPASRQSDEAFALAGNTRPR